MIAPARPLLWLAAAVVLPAATAAALDPRIAGPCLAAIGACVLAAVYDAVAGLQRVGQIEASAPPLLRLTKDVASALPLTLENRLGSETRIRLAAAAPARIEFREPVTTAVAMPGRSALELACTARQRGDASIEAVDIEAQSPWGLWAARAHRTIDCVVRVYPNLRDRATAGLFLRTANPGMRVHRQVGKGREFENLRQYMPGDSFEDIHWKATAKRSFPAVKLYRVEHAQEVYAVIDASRLSVREGILDAYIDAALHLALVAERQGDRFGLAVFSDRTQRFIRARSGLDHFRMCREAIHNLKAERVSPDFREVFTALQLNLRRRSLLVFFTSLDDALLAENFEHDVPLLARRHLVLVNVTRTPGMEPLFTGSAPASLDALYSGLAGQMLWNRMRRLKIALQNRGVKLAVVDPERIKLEVTSQYLDVKRRQAL